MSKTKLGSNAQFTGTNKSLSIYGDRLSAMSGAIECDNNETDLINTTTGKYVTIADVLFSYAETTQGDNMLYRIRLNGIEVWQHTRDHSTVNYAYPNAIKILIPPLTEVRLTCQNATDTSNQSNLVVMTGRVY